LDPWEGGEAFVVELLEGGQVGGDDAQQVVGFAEEPLSFPDVGDGGDSLFERVDGGAVSAAHRDEDQSLEGEAECVGVEVCVVAADGAGVFQGAQPAVAGERLRPTLSASSVTVRRPFCCSSARIVQSSVSMRAILPSFAGVLLKTWKHISRVSA
jgi:hypothetical protein